MRIGINGSGLIATGASVGELCRHAQDADAQGFASYWVGQLAIPDALTLIAVMGQRADRLEFGTSVVPTWARHPLMLAAQALTVQEAIANRLAIGVGLGHRDLVEPALKIPYTRLAQHMEEYLAVLAPVLRERRVSFTGEIWSGEDDLSAAMTGATPPPLLLAAMGPRMLALAGRQADGVILWLAGPRTIEDMIVPSLTASAAEAGRPLPRVVAGLPVCVTDDAERVRAQIDHVLGKFARFDSYKRVLEREGVSGPGSVALVGDEDEVRAGAAALADAGVTDFAATEFTSTSADAAATRALLRELAQSPAALAVR